ncbi:uncharacterized protein LOC132178089 [Corylus avellana]|uniref:uncharacterized protein LOC132178089 n=1 Tax=Corylus avellana TaxID=13451 RepID=UPI00286C3A77|nr:uncharacterized protein LOC132178089 [Corylus avellana]
MEIKGYPAFRWSTKMRNPPYKRTNQKYCEYHNDDGHLTEECISLRRGIENFIRNCRLVRFLADGRNRGREPQEPLRRDGNNEAPDGRWDDRVGLIGRGESNSARKAHARRVNVDDVFLLERPSKAQKKDPMILSFSEDDAEGVAMPHNDALVVKVTVGNHSIHRILVDNRSSVDILYWPVYKQMGIDRERIKPFGSPKVGFAGEQVQPIRLVSLPVIVGTTPKQVTIMVGFLVVDRPSAYNVIIGQLALNKLKAKTLTYLLKMKFLTDDGVGEVKGNQIAARKCYNTSLKKSSDLHL